MGNVVALKHKRILDAILPELPEDADQTQKERIAATKRVIDPYVPSIMRQGYEKARAEMQPLMDAGATAACAKVDQAHAKELQSLALHMHDTAQHIKGASFWRGVGFMACATVLLCGATGFGVSWFITQSQMNAVAITQAATRPSAEQMRQSMQPQEGGGFRP